MSTLTLKQQISRQGQLIADAIDRLHPSDASRPWFRMELKSYRRNILNESLEAQNGQLRALRQLQHLLFEHCVLIQNRDFPVSEDSFSESYLSLRARLPADVHEVAQDFLFSIEPELLFSREWNVEQFDPVSPTAKVVAYLRSRDRSLAITSDVTMESEGERLLRETCGANESTIQKIANLFNSRHHSINAAITASSVSQIIECAVGISPRGLQWAQSMPNTIYVESDLPALMIHKAKLLRNHIFDSGLKNLGVLHCCGANVLDLESILGLTNSIDAALPFTIVTEGLLLYFSAAELDQFLRNMQILLSQFPHATWVTDFVTQSDLSNLFRQHQDVAQTVRKVFDITGRAVVRENPLHDDDSVVEWMNNHRLRVADTTALADVAEHMTDGEEVDDIASVLGNRKIWSITGAH